MKKLVIALLILVIAAGAWIVNDEINERIANLKDKHRTEVSAIKKTLSRVEQERDDARQQRDSVRGELQSTRDALQSTTRRLRTSESTLSGVRRSYRELESASGDLDQIRAEVSSLETRRWLLHEEIKVLEQQKASLIGQRPQRFPLPRTNQRTHRSGLYCTGSMSPTITCMDEVTYLQHFNPAEISVGHVISFYPDCWDSDDGIHTVHRVIDIQVHGGTYWYWPKGDSNFEADGCWIPAANVDGVAIEVHRNVRPLNAELHSLMIAAKSELYAAQEAYYAVRDRYCAREGQCTVPHDVYPRVTRLRLELEEAAEVYSCWADVAKASRYAGHIPWRC